jgi:biopolymer transport protein ExbB
MSSLATKFHEGGIFMYFILICGCVAGAFMLERFYALYLNFKKPIEGFRAQVLSLISSGDYKTGENFFKASEAKSPLARIASKGFAVRKNLGADDELQARMDEALAIEISRLDKRTGFLGMLGNVATLVGLLGTIAGMITSFAAVAAANPMDRATLLSKGISEAMNCTAFGLIVAIPALVSYAIFQSRTEKLISELTEDTTGIYNDMIYLSDLAPGSRAFSSVSSAGADQKTGQSEIRV